MNMTPAQHARTSKRWPCMGDACLSPVWMDPSTSVSKETLYRGIGDSFSKNASSLIVMVILWLQHFQSNKYRTHLGNMIIFKHSCSGLWLRNTKVDTTKANEGEEKQKEEGSNQRHHIALIPVVTSEDINQINNTTTMFWISYLPQDSTWKLKEIQGLNWLFPNLSKCVGMRKTQLANTRPN